jgi:hypothetical protein
MLLLVVSAQYMLGQQLINVTDKQQQNDQQNAAPGQQNATPDQQNAAPGQQNASPDQQNAAPGQQNASPDQQNAAPGQQNASPDQQNAAPEQQMPPASQGQASSTAAIQSVTGCVVQSDHGYSLKTENDSYPIETDKDLSQYVNKRIRITGILEHHTAAPSATSGNTAVISDIRLRTVASVVGDCNQPSK